MKKNSFNMRYTAILVVGLFLVLISCKADFYPGQISRMLGPGNQKFDITIGQDTIVRCKGGMVLRFCPNTFICTEKQFELQVQEVRNRGEAFLLGISTVASNGRMLETEGMIYLKGVAAHGALVSINTACPISLEVPMKGRRAGTQWFYGNDSGKRIVWDQIPGGLSNGAEILKLETGQYYFNKLCTTCHCPSLSTNQTGPALGNITKYRDQAWLRQFTRNSYSFIGTGDSLAVCAWEKWKPTIMSPFPELSDDQIDAIYTFIEEESSRLGVTLDSSHYSCDPQSRYQHTVDSIPTIMDGRFKTNPYFAKIYRLGWHNCDLFYNDSTARPAVVKITIANPELYDEVLVGLMFDELNSSITLEPYENGQFETFRNMDIKLPQVSARIIAIGIKGKRWFKYERTFTIGPENVFTAELKQVTNKEIQSFIKTNSFKEPQVEIARQPCGVEIPGAN